MTLEGVATVVVWVVVIAAGLGVLKIYDHFTQFSMTVIAMESNDPDALRREVEKLNRPLPPDQAVAILAAHRKYAYLAPNLMEMVSSAQLRNPNAKIFVTFKNL